MTKAKSMYLFGLQQVRRSRATMFAAVAFLLLLATLAAAIVISHDQSSAQAQSNFALRGQSSARFASTYLSQQASRETHAAKRYLSGTHVSEHDFKLIAATLNSSAAVLLDASGRVLDAYPQDPSPCRSPTRRARTSPPVASGRPPRPSISPASACPTASR